jgi:hypothetical protein
MGGSGRRRDPRAFPTLEKVVYLTRAGIMTILLFTCISLKFAEQNTAKSENLRFASKIVNLF